MSSFDESMFAGKGQLIAICQYFSHYSGSDVKSEAKTPSGEHLLSMDKVFKWLIFTLIDNFMSKLQGLHCVEAYLNR